MYKDKELDEKGFILDVHNMTYGEAEEITNSKSMGIPYYLSTEGSSGIMRVDGNGNTRYALHQIIIILAYDL